MEILDLVVPAGNEAPRMARSAVRDAAALLPGDRVDDVRLLINELVTNSVKHASVEQGAPIRVNIEIRRDAVRGEVRDQGAGFRLRPIASDGPAESGYGLRLVQKMADRWGLNVRDGTCVWFEMDLAPQSRVPKQAQG